MCMCLHVCTCVCMYVHVFTCMYMCMHVCTCVYMYVHVYTCMYNYMYADILPVQCIFGYYMYMPCVLMHCNATTQHMLARANNTGNIYGWQ